MAHLDITLISPPVLLKPAGAKSYSLLSSHLFPLILSHYNKENKITWKVTVSLIVLAVNWRECTNNLLFIFRSVKLQIITWWVEADHHDSSWKRGGGQKQNNTYTHVNSFSDSFPDKYTHTYTQKVFLCLSLVLVMAKGPVNSLLCDGVS